MKYRILFSYKGVTEVVDLFKSRKEADWALEEYRVAFGAALSCGALLWRESI
jgi:hypothetical protein